MDYFIQNPWALTMLDIIAKSLIITSFTFLMLFFLRNQIAALRHQICAISLLSLPLLLIASIYIPSIPIPILPAPQVQAMTTPFSIDQPMFQTIPSPLEPMRQSQERATIIQQPHQQTQEIRQENVYPLPLLIWISGTIFLLLSFLFHIKQRNQITQQAILISDHTWAHHITHARQILQIKPSAQILKSKDIQIPLTYGWRKPIILLPHNAADWSSEQQRIVLLHEMAHIKRKDQFIQSLCHISLALFWFNPLVWILKRRLQTEQERACDDLVINTGISASDYATQLLNIARNLSSNTPIATVPFARKADLPNRIRLILNTRINRTPSPFFTSLFTSLLLIIPTFAIAPLYTAQQDIHIVNHKDDISNDQQNKKSITHSANHDSSSNPNHLWKSHSNHLNRISSKTLFLTPLSQPINTFNMSSKKLDLTKNNTMFHRNERYVQYQGMINKSGPETSSSKSPSANQTQDPFALNKAVANGDLREVRRLLAAGYNINELGENGPPILLAIQNGHHVIVQELLDHGADLSLQSEKNGETLLMIAVRAGNMDLIRQTLAKGTDVNAISHKGESALHLAAKGNHTEILQLLLDHGANVNIKGYLGTTPLFAAAQAGQSENLKILLQHGADIHIKTLQGNSALSPAIHSKNTEVVKLLLENGIEVNERLESGFYPLYEASNNVEIMELLLDHGADPQMSFGYTTPLQWAITQGNNEAVALLLDKTPQKRGTIYGIVSDRQTGASIDNGGIIIEELGRFATIGKSGIYYLSDLPNGSYTLKTLGIGYGPKTAKSIQLQEGFTTTYHMHLSSDAQDDTAYRLGSFIYRYASNKGHAYVVVQYTTPKTRTLVHGPQYVNQLHQASKEILTNWSASKFESNLNEARQLIKNELNTFIKDPETGQAGVAEVYIGNYGLTH